MNTYITNLSRTSTVPEKYIKPFYFATVFYRWVQSEYRQSRVILANTTYVFYRRLTDNLEKVHLVVFQSLVHKSCPPVPLHP